MIIDAHLMNTYETLGSLVKVKHIFQTFSKEVVIVQVSSSRLLIVQEIGGVFPLLSSQIGVKIIPRKAIIHKCKQYR